MIPAILEGCKQQRDRVETKGWHPHLSSDDISAYMDEVAPKHLWWCRPVPPPAEPSEDGV